MLPVWSGSQHSSAVSAAPSGLCFHPSTFPTPCRRAAGQHSPVKDTFLRRRRGLHAWHRQRDLALLDFHPVAPPTRANPPDAGASHDKERRAARVSRPGEATCPAPFHLVPSRELARRLRFSLFAARNFPVSPKKFPVPMRRETGCNHLNCTLN